MAYLPETASSMEEMLKDAGCSSFSDLLADVPKDVALEDPLDLEDGLSESGVARSVESLSAKNKVYGSIFRGAGAYDHFIPSVVGRVVRKEKFLTAYTPYQAEISQGVLQSIFEYQSYICRLTGMDVSNASVYDGAVAAAEGAMMCLTRKKTKLAVSAALSPEVLSVVKTYAYGRGVELVELPLADGKTDFSSLESVCDESLAGVVMAWPNYFGILEDIESAANKIHEAGAKLVLFCNPISLALLKSPAELGADIAVGEGQPLGMPLSFGGPYLGFMAAKSELMRQLPGRIVGETTDKNGDRAFVLTLQAREQHIKREKAGSNICSNEALCALTAAVYLSAMGPDGLCKAASQCASNAHYLADGLCGAGLELAYPDAEFFHEFVTALPSEYSGDKEEAVCKITKALSENGILGGLPLCDGRILWCATEKNTKEEMDKVISIVGEVLR